MINVLKESPIRHSSLDVNQLIDLFVDLNFTQLEDERAISQFKVLAIQMGYPIDMINSVIKLGIDEYYKLLVEVDNLVAST